MIGMIAMVKAWASRKAREIARFGERRWEKMG